MSANVIEQLDAAAAPLLAARSEIEKLRADVEAHQAELAGERQALAERDAELAALRAQLPQELARVDIPLLDGMPPLPRQPKIYGIAHDGHGTAMTRCDADLAEYGRRCFSDGIKVGRKPPAQPPGEEKGWRSWERDRHKTADLMRQAEERNRTATRTNTRSAERPPKGRKT